ncbi:MAG TPA: twin-arginine translocase TatA/TatE family subunit [Candidatus Limnocylindria bacterium]|nr:twin-arginine translocase TatA/TatE family subunit [Candidatus Limnocylindria bacterium]
MPFNIGPFELLLVLILALLVLGPGKLPEVGNALGKTIREFRRASTDVQDSLRIDAATAPASGRTAATQRQPEPDPQVQALEERLAALERERAQVEQQLKASEQRPTGD